MSKVKERLIEYIKTTRKNISEFEREIGVSSGYISNISKSIQPDKLEIISEKHPSLNIEWLLVGIGSMLKADTINDNSLIIDTAIWSRFEEFARKNYPNYIKDLKGMSVELNMNSSRLKDLLIDGAFLKYSEILTLSYAGVNIDWLLTGKGSMLKSEQPTPVVSYSTGRPYYNVDFIGGFDLVLNDQTINPEYNIDFAPYNKEGVLWCNVTGHSMEPEIHHGDTMAIKKMNASNIDYLPFGEVYAIVTDEYRTVKRISKAEKDGFIKLIPSNPSPEYTAQDIPQAMIRAIYQVLVSVKRF